MRKLVFLKTCLDFLFFILILGGILLIIAVPIFLFGGDSGIPIEINNYVYEKVNAGVVLICVFALLSYLLFIYSVFWFRKIIRFFMKTQLFHEDVLKGFKHIGICFVLISIFMHIPKTVYLFLNRYEDREIGFRLTLIDGLFDSFWFMLCLGLFFMVLGTVFRIAKNAKEDNELTV